MKINIMIKNFYLLIFLIIVTITIFLVRQMESEFKLKLNSFEKKINLITFQLNINTFEIKKNNLSKGIIDNKILYLILMVQN